MLIWVDDSNKYEEIQKSYFGSYEITVIKFSAGGTCAWAKQPGIISPTLLKKNYPIGTTLEETKELFLKALHEHLDERVNYWRTIQYALMEAELEDDVND